MIEIDLTTAYLTPTQYFDLEGFDFLSIVSSTIEGDGFGSGVITISRCNAKYGTPAAFSPAKEITAAGLTTISASDWGGARYLAFQCTTSAGATAHAKLEIVGKKFGFDPNPKKKESYYLTAQQAWSSTTITPITDGVTPWVLPIKANETWLVSCVLMFEQWWSANDVKIKLSGPSGAAGRFLLSGVEIAASRWHDLGTEGAIAVNDGTDDGLLVDGIVINGSNAGDITIEIANNSGSGTTTLGEYSYVTFERI
jgi:hypothetical protein